MRPLRTSLSAAVAVVLVLLVSFHGGERALAESHTRAQLQEGNQVRHLRSLLAHRLRARDRVRIKCDFFDDCWDKDNVKKDAVGDWVAKAGKSVAKVFTDDKTSTTVTESVATVSGILALTYLGIWLVQKAVSKAATEEAEGAISESEESSTVSELDAAKDTLEGYAQELEAEGAVAEEIDDDNAADYVTQLENEGVITSDQADTAALAAEGGDVTADEIALVVEDMLTAIAESMFEFGV